MSHHNPVLHSSSGYRTPQPSAERGKKSATRRENAAQRFLTALAAFGERLYEHRRKSGYFEQYLRCCTAL